MKMTDSLPDIPLLGFGLGLRGVHIPHILEHKPELDWFEIISENYMGNDGPARRRLEEIRAHYLVVMHGVSLSIGTVDPLNSTYLKELKNLADWLQPAWISDHLCWTGVAHKNTHDLLPVPYTKEALAHIVDRIKRVQDTLGRRLVLENPSTYLEFKSSEMPEEAFIAQMVESADCRLLLDVNNIYVTCCNHRKNTRDYIDALPLDRVAQIHLAGHSNNGTHIVDTHDAPVIDEVWNLYRYVIAKAGLRNTMIEWDDKIPPFETLNAELDKARAAAESPVWATLPDFGTQAQTAQTGSAPPLRAEQNRMQDAILKGGDTAPADWIRDKQDFGPDAQLAVYTNGYRLRLQDVTMQDYPALRVWLGHEKMKTLVQNYVEATPSGFYDAGLYPAALPGFINDDPVAIELATLERAIAQTATAPETRPLTPAHLEGLSPDALMARPLHLRAALTLLDFIHDINTLYTACMDNDAPSHVTAAPSFLAVFRHEGTVWRLPLDKDEYNLLKFLQQGASLGAAIDALPCDEDTLAANLPAWIARWMANGILAQPQQDKALENAA